MPSEKPVTRDSSAEAAQRSITPTPPSLAVATLAFLRVHPPFDRMGEAALIDAVGRFSLAYFPRDAIILAPEFGPVSHLYVIRRGLVGSRPEDPRIEADPPLGPGELFPAGALSANGASTRIYHAIQDTFCLRLTRDDYLALRERSPEFDRYCAQATTETLKQSLAQLQGQYSQLAAEQQTLTRPLGELVRNALVSCTADMSLATALPLMDRHNVRTLACVDREGRPLGILTLVDVLRRVVLPQRPLTTPVGEVMTSPAIALPANASAYEAMQAMAEHAVRQVCVVEGNTLIGVVNERDLFALSRVSMRQLLDGLRAATSTDLLQRAAADIRGLTRNLLAQGVAAEPLTRTITALNDAVTRRAIDLTLTRHDIPAGRWCWLALGSEGRGEQTFATDQDNALLFEPPSPKDADAMRDRLVAMAREVNERLATLGFPLCTGNVMAGNVELCLTLAEWKDKFLRWMSGPTPLALLRANIMFDFRALYGDMILVDELRAWLHARSPHEPLFLRMMAQNALEVAPPLGVLRPFATDDDREPRGTLDLKGRGTRLFVDAARVFALAFGVHPTNTIARLREAGQHLKLDTRQVGAIVEAFLFLQMLRLRQQDFAVVPADPNRLAPDTLNEVDRRMLKEAFRQARGLQDLVRGRWPL